MEDVETPEVEVEAETPAVETADETAARIFMEMSEGVEEATEAVEEVEEEAATEEPAEEDEEKTEDEKPKRKRKKKTYNFEGEVAPPSDWSAEAKEWFKTQPDEYKQQTGRIAAQYQSHRQQQVTLLNERLKEVQAKAAEIDGTVKVISRFLPRWGAAGKTPEAAISELCAFNELVIKDPDAALEALAKTTGRKITIEGKQQKTVAQSYNVTNTNPEEIYQRVKQDLAADNQRAHQQQRVEAEAHEIDAIFQGLKDEVSESGQYCFPDMHDEYFKAELQPLAAGIKRANPGLDWREIILRSYRAANGRIIPRRATQIAKLNGNNRTELAKRAARSVPGSLNSNHLDLDARPGESTLETATRIYAQLNQR